MYRKYPLEKSQTAACFGGAWGKKEYCDKRQYGKGTHAIFESINVIIPELYDQYLTQKYGDYLILPPLEKQIPHHYCDIIDLENPYTKYFKGQKATTVITYGTFDLLHYGHINLLKRAAQLGNKLIVGVSTDQCCLEKGKKCVYDLKKRMEMVSDLKFVDIVIPEANMKQKIDDIKKYDVDIFVLGDDYKKTFPIMKEYQEVNRLCKIVFLERTPDISTTALKNDIIGDTGKNIPVFYKLL